MTFKYDKNITFKSILLKNRLFLSSRIFKIKNKENSKCKICFKVFDTFLEFYKESNISCTKNFNNKIL